MRVGIVRSDIDKVYLADVENTSQRNFSSEPAGQSRYFRKPSDASLTDLIENLAAAVVAAGTTAATLLADLKTAVYPSAVTIDVSSATILGSNAGYAAELTAGEQAAFAAAVADLVAPSLVETGPVLLSFAHGNLAELASASFQPGGERSGLPAGVCAAIVEDDGSTPFAL